MQQSPSCENNQFSASQEISRILCRPKVHYSIHKFPPPVRVLSQIDPVHAPAPHSTSWRSILILSSHLSLILPRDLFSSDFPTKTLFISLLAPKRATCPTHLILLDLVTRTMKISYDMNYKTLSFLYSVFIIMKCWVMNVWNGNYNAWISLSWLYMSIYIWLSKRFNTYKTEAVLCLTYCCTEISLDLPVHRNSWFLLHSSISTSILHYQWTRTPTEPIRHGTATVQSSAYPFNPPPEMRDLRFSWRCQD